MSERRSLAVCVLVTFAFACCCCFNMDAARFFNQKQAEDGLKKTRFCCSISMFGGREGDLIKKVIKVELKKFSAQDY